MSSFGIFVAIMLVEHDTHKYKGILDMKKYPNAMDHPRNTDLTGIFLRMLILTTTIITLFFAY